MLGWARWIINQPDRRIVQLQLLSLSMTAAAAQLQPGVTHHQTANSFLSSLDISIWQIPQRKGSGHISAWLSDATVLAPGVRRQVGMCKYYCEIILSHLPVANVAKHILLQSTYLYTILKDFFGIYEIFV